MSVNFTSGQTKSKPILPAFGQNHGSIKCSLKEKTNNLVASQPQDIVIQDRQHHNNFCHLRVICVDTEDTYCTCQTSRIPWCSQRRDETFSLVAEHFSLIKQWEKCVRFETNSVSVRLRFKERQIPSSKVKTVWAWRMKGKSFVQTNNGSLRRPDSEFS